MRKAIQIIILTLICIISVNCKEVVKTTFENRNLFVFVGENPTENEYTLTVEMRTEICNYNYKNERDSRKNMKFQLDLKSETLNFADSEFYPVKGLELKLNELSETPFKTYKLVKPEIDGIGPILFNKEYGILAIGNVMAPEFVYLPKKEDKETAKRIRKKLIE